jgi:hypothetical protein
VFILVPFVCDGNIVPPFLQIVNRREENGFHIAPKSALVDFLVSDFAFGIVHKSTWHMNTILLFTEKE